MSLEGVAEKVLGTTGKKVQYLSTCEIDPNCQKVLKSTYGNRCNWPDVTKLGDSETAWCSTHQKRCPTEAAKIGKRRVSAKKEQRSPGLGSQLLSWSDPHLETLFWHSFWHTIWKCIWQIYSDIMSGILSGIYSDILSDILSGSILTYILSDILSDILSGIYSDILSGIYSDTDIPVLAASRERDMAIWSWSRHAPLHPARKKG